MKNYSIAYFISLTLTACSGDAIDLGEDRAALSAPSHSLCRDSASYDGSISLVTQAGLDSLTGCEHVNGDLDIFVANGNLAALQTLRSISGLLSLQGSDEYAPNFLASITSLAGLESLERVGALHLEGLSISNLEPLSGLKGSMAHITISNCDELTSLAALSNVENVDTFEVIDNAKLESLAPIQINSGGQLILTNNPILTNVGVGIPPYLTAVSIEGSNISELDFLSPLGAATQVAIIDNPLLEDTSGLSSLVDLGALLFIKNPNVTKLPEFEKLYSLQRLTIVDNSRLQGLPPMSGLVEGLGSALDPLGEVRWPVAETGNQLSILEIEDNPALTTFTLPVAWSVARTISIARNESLATMNLNNLESLDHLVISDNPALATMEINSLATVDALEILNNPQLSTVKLETVLTFSRDVSGNAAD